MATSDEIFVLAQPSISFSAWLDDHHPVEIIEVEEKRHGLAASLFSIALAHRRAILDLVMREHLASAFALIRSAMEAQIRGAWVAYCASGQQLQQCRELGWLPEASKAATEVDKKTGTTYAAARASSYKQMCEFSHGGMLQASHWISGTTIGPAYPTAEIKKLLRQADLYGFLALREMALLAGMSEEPFASKAAELQQTSQA